MKTFAISMSVLGVVFWSFFILHMSGCAWFDKVEQPLSPAPVPGNPCGQAYVYCGNDDAGAIECCDENEACIAGGMCEDIGGGVAAKKPHPQHAPRAQ